MVIHCTINICVVLAYHLLSFPIIESRRKIWILTGELPDFERPKLPQTQWAELEQAAKIVKYPLANTLVEFAKLQLVCSLRSMSSQNRWQNIVNNGLSIDWEHGTTALPLGFRPHVH